MEEDICNSEYKSKRPGGVDSWRVTGLRLLLVIIKVGRLGGTDLRPD
jgi:hypothetical protein